MSEIESAIISQLSEDLQMDLPSGKSLDELKNVITDRINYLINADFDKLLRILYAVDVSEMQLKNNLQQGVDAGAVIAQMIIDRQLQKIKTREQYRTSHDIPEDEKW
jgi:hypothetical protein